MEVAVGKAEFAGWVRPNWVAMVRVARRLVSGDEGDDVVQEALAAAWRARDTFDPNKGTVRGWLLTITARQAMKTARLRARKDSLSTRWQVEPVEASISVDLADAIRVLPLKQRECIWLYYYCDLSISETAELLRCAEGTVKSNLFDARASLRVGLLKGEVR